MTAFDARRQKDARSRDLHGRAQFTCYTAASIGPGNPWFDASATSGYPHRQQTESDKTRQLHFIAIHGNESRNCSE